MENRFVEHVLKGREVRFGSGTVRVIGVIVNFVPFNFALAFLSSGLFEWTRLLQSGDRKFCGGRFGFWLGFFVEDA